MEQSNSSLPPSRCAVFIDGFNMYFGVLKEHPEYRWLNIQSFFEDLRANDDVRSIHYFTALLDPKLLVSDRRNRQKQYLAALASLSKVSIVYGKYQAREVECGAQCRKRYRVPEEKKTDVNIAVRMIDGAIRQQVDTLILVSGDSDLEPAVEWIRQNYPKIKITVYVPALAQKQGNRQNHFYNQIGVNCRVLPLAGLPLHQLPDPVIHPDGRTLTRLSEWK